MVELVPSPFPRLVTRMFRELERKDAIFDLPRGKFFTGSGRHDLGVTFHGHRAATALGPAAGPHSQMAQNIVLAWLGGSRIVELKTVQILDQLEIPRPCIDMRNVGYNVEWSQELRLEQSLEEYVKASMLIDMLVASGELELADGATDVIYDMSVGYDLAGIRSPRVQAFLAGMQDASALVERLRAQIPAALARFKDLEFRTRLADTLTLSTFHGCPPDEIEAIIDYLLREHGLHCVIKLNPTLLGKDTVRGLLHDRLGYGHVTVPDSAYAKDATWEQATGFVERLRDVARDLGLGLGVKCTNTLVVEHDGDFLPASEKEKFLSGPPLHVLAVHLVGRLRERFGTTVPVSFSAGIDRQNFPDAVALGLTPITVCSDLLKPGGYARQQGYLAELTRRMDGVGATQVGDWVIRGFGHGAAALASCDEDRPELRAALDDGRDLRDLASDVSYAKWVRAAILQNTTDYVARVASDPRYAHDRNTKLPKKIGSHLELFDCVTCDKCIPVCPNDANFALTIPPQELPLRSLRHDGSGVWILLDRGTIRLDQKHQIANFADFCNECGNCDVFCPEDGGPYVVKPRFFGSEAEWRSNPGHDGFFVAKVGATDHVLGRFDGAELRAAFTGPRVAYAGTGFDVEFAADDPAGTAQGSAAGDVDLGYVEIMGVVRTALLGADVHWVNVG